MLSETRKEMIALEERYRLKIREELEAERAKKATRSERLLNFCNSAFGLFLLTTVFVGIFSSSFTWTVAKYKAAGAHQEHQRRLRLEILNRVDEISIMRTRFRGEYRDVVKSALYGFRVGETQNPSWKLFYSPMFPEFRERSLYSLVWELEEGSDTHDRARIRTARNEVRPVAGSLYQLIEQSEPPPAGSAEAEPRTFYILPEGNRGALVKHLDALSRLIADPPH